MFTPSPHPVYKIPSRDQYEKDPDATFKYLLAREQKIKLEIADPLRYGFEPDSWQLARKAIAEGKRELVILGGNRAAKTEFAAKLTHEVLGGRENAEVWACQTTEDNSIQMQQPYLWKYMPPEYTNIKKNTVTNIQYTKKNGFSNGVFIYPNGSRCVCKNYAQDVKVIEGGECDLIWCDELVPLDWIETLRYRLVTRGGLLLITFTAIQGWSPTVKEYLQGAKVILSRPAELLGNTPVPLIQQPKRKNSSVIYFHTKDNPFAGYDNLVKLLDGAPREEILTRAYGVPVRSATTQFPKFDETIHVVRPDQVPTTGTRYQFIDPASGRNWFMLWVILDARGRHFVYREWPAEGSHVPGEGDVGAWAIPDGKLHDGKAGEGQRCFGWGLKKYVSEIYRVEGKKLVEGEEETEVEAYDSSTGEEVFQRWMDSRFGATPTMKNDQTNTLLDQLNQELDFPIHPAPYDMIDEGVSLINDLLDYDKLKPIDINNEPRLYVSSDCPAVIFALKEWTGRDGKTGASKDPVDCLRYMAMARLVDVDGVPACTEVNCY
jgi:Terminase large subunit, T4likevirus-type, N-terminal